MLSQPRSVDFLDEPFNVSLPNCVCGTRFDCWFLNIADANETAIRRHVQHLLASPLNVYNLAQAVWRSLVLTSSHPFRRNLRGLFTRRSVVKDPIAVNSAEWLAATFDMRVIVMIRHPAAVAASYKRLGWTISFSDLLSQASLIREHLSPFETEITDFARHERAPFEQATLLWKLVYSRVSKYREAHGDWIFIRYEELANDPAEGFRTLFEELDLEYSDRVHRVVMEHSAPTNPVESEDPHSVMRNSAKSIWRWKNELTEPEIGRVRNRVEGIADAFYSDEDW